MNCPLQTNEGADLILDYCANRLEADHALQFERHVKGCEECGRVVSAQRAVWEALDSYQALPVSEDFDERLWRKIEAAESRNWWQKLMDGPALGWSSLFSWKPAMVTASACAAVFAVMVFTQPSTNVEQSPVVVEKAMVERTVDIDQVEGAIDDLDMLKQMGVVDDGNAPGAM